MKKRIIITFSALLFIMIATRMSAQQDDGRVVFDDPNKRTNPTDTQDEDLRPRKSAWGIDLMVSEGGFGFGAFYHRAFAPTLTGFFSTSISEAKDPHEFEQYGYWGDVSTPFKINRIFRVPLFFGLQQRLFAESIADNFRPYLTAGAGPVFIYTTPAQTEWFSAFKKGHPYYTAGGFVGIGADFGFDRSVILGVNLRYYIIPLPTGIESSIGRRATNVSGIFFALNIGGAY